MRRTLSDYHSGLNQNVKRTACILTIGMLVLFMGANVSFAQPTTFTGVAGGFWNNPANWSAGVPHAGSLVYFAATSAPSIMNMSGLNIAALDMTGYTGLLNLQGDLTVNGDVTLTSTVQVANTRKLNVTGDAALDGQFDLGFGGLTVGGTLRVYGTLEGLSGTVIAQVLDGTGTMIGDMVVGTSGGTLNFASMAQVAMSGGAVLLDSGSIVAAATWISEPWSRTEHRTS